MKHFFLTVLLFQLVGLAADTQAAEPKKGTLAENMQFPVRDIERLCEPSVWRKIRDLEYTGFVVMDGRLDASGRVSIRKTSEKFPDDTRTRLATVLGNKVVLQGAASASRIPQKATVWVIFYENLRGSESLALVFAKQSGGSSEANTGGAYFTTVTY